MGKVRQSRSFVPCLEALEARDLPSAVSINAGQAVRTVTDQLLGVNLTMWDSALGTTQTRQMVQSAGLRMFRLPGGSATDSWHFADPPAYNGQQTAPDFAALINAVGGTGLVTLNYGTASPQESAAFLAYLNGKVGDPTVLGSGLQWSDASSSWVSKDWKTAGYWAGLRAATPLAQDDGLNFLRAGRAAPFGMKYFEVGNEVYGSWETDHHATPHDPATYVGFAATFAGYAAQIDPTISIGLDASGTGGSYSQIPGNWTAQVLQQCAQQKFMPGFLSDHNYMFDPGSENDATLLLHSATDPSASGYGGPINWAGRASAYRALLTQYLGSAGAGVQLLATETNSVSYNPSNQTTSLVNGLWLADSLGGLLQTEYNGAITWDLRNGYDTSHHTSSVYGWRSGGDYGLLGTDNGSAPATGTYVPYPTWFAEQLLSQMVHTGDTVVQANSSDPNLAVYAVKQQNGHLDLLVINKSASADLTGTFGLADFTPTAQSTAWQYGEAQDTAQSQTTDGHSALASFAQSLTVSGSSFSDTFPRYSMTVLDLAPASGGTSGSGDNTAFVLRADHSLAEYSQAGLVELSPAGTILAISAASDGPGKQAVFVITSDGHLWEHSPDIPGGWALISSGSFQSISAATNSAGSPVAFGVLADNSLWEYSSLFTNSGHWQLLSPGGTVLSTSAGTDAGGQDTVFAITADRNLWRHTSAGWALLSSGSFQSVSAGQGGDGTGVAFAVLTDRSLWEYSGAFSNPGHWQVLSPAGTVLSVAAAGREEAFAITSDGHLWDHTPAGWSLVSVGAFGSVSGSATAAGAGEVFAVLADGSLWEYNPAFPGSHWNEAMGQGVLAVAVAQPS
jgi:hypothetical protein